MKLIKIILGKNDIKNVDTFRDILEFHLQQVKQIGLHYSMKELTDKEFIHFNCQFWPMLEHTIETQEGLRRAVSFAVAEYIIKCKEEELLKEILTAEFGFSQEEEQNCIISFANSLLQDSEYGEKSETIHKNLVKDKIVEKAMDYLWLEHTLTIDGFVRFRIKEQWEQWRLLVQHAIDEYLADKEYKEFIQLVRFNLSSQETKTNQLHILHIDDLNLYIFNENWQQVSLEKTEQQAVTKSCQPKNHEDLLLGALLNMAPQHLIIHTDQENHHIIYTLKRIFEDRVNICSRCMECDTKFNQIMDCNV